MVRACGVGQPRDWRAATALAGRTLGFVTPVRKDDRSSPAACSIFHLPSAIHHHHHRERLDDHRPPSTIHQPSTVHRPPFSGVPPECTQSHHDEVIQPTTSRCSLLIHTVLLAHAVGAHHTNDLSDLVSPPPPTSSTNPAHRQSVAGILHHRDWGG